ncbi:retroviral-like aspartic protease family protein [candidate division KSB1 bacterium]|nr:retroviral-like aspartic protease family protein [candidate division KSB1 bacterium]
MTTKYGMKSHADITSRMREALKLNNLERQTGNIIIEGEATNAGTDGTFRLTFNLDGRFTRRLETQLSETAGFDGVAGWMVDWTGMPCALGQGELEWQQLVAGAQTGLWLRENSPFAITALDAGASNAELILSVIYKNGSLQAEARVDAASWLVKSFRHQGIHGEEALELGDYKEIAGWVLPGRVLHKLNNIPIASFELRSIAMRPSNQADDPYRPITARPNDTQFDHAVPPQLEVRRAPTGHFLIRAKINGHDCGWFILDTGASSSTISHEIAARLQLAQIGTVPLTSIFGVVASPVRRTNLLGIGPFALQRPIFVEMDFTPVNQAFGLSVAGVIGYDLFSRAIIKIDVAGSAVSIHDPRAYQRRDGNWQELVIQYQTPVVRASFEGNHQRWFCLDIGAAVTVMFHTPTVRELDLLKDRNGTPSRLGQFEVMLGAMAWFELAGHRFDQPKVIFVTSENGPVADPHTAGNIGLEFLQPFKLIFDYANQRIAFE